MCVCASLLLLENSLIFILIEIVYYLFFQDDEDGHVFVLTIIDELMTKDPEEFLDHFARLGVFTKVQALMGDNNSYDNNESDVIKSEDLASGGCALPVLPTPNAKSENQLEDAKEILPGKAYHWRDWSICRGRDCLYIWSDSAALELSNGSNGWFRFILDGKLATMYSSGSPENGSDNTGDLT